MRKIGLGCGLFILALVVILFLGCQIGGKHQAEFFQAFFSGDPEKVISMCHPAIREKVDAPVLLAYMNSAHDHLGSYTRMSPTDFNSSSNFSGNVKTVEIKGTAEFEKGKAKTELVYQNDVITSFEIVPENFSRDWIKKLAGTKLFQDRGKEFLNLIVSGENEKAYSQMHEELKKIITPEKLGEMSKKVSEILGKPKSIVFDSEKMEVSVPNESYLYIDFKVEGDKATLNGQVKFQFIGFKAFILGFYIKP